MPHDKSQSSPPRTVSPNKRLGEKKAETNAGIAADTVIDFRKSYAFELGTIKLNQPLKNTAESKSASPDGQPPTCYLIRNRAFTEQEKTQAASGSMILIHTQVRHGYQIGFADNGTYVQLSLSAPKEAKEEKVQAPLTKRKLPDAKTNDPQISIIDPEDNYRRKSSLLSNISFGFALNQIYSGEITDPGLIRQILDFVDSHTSKKKPSKQECLEGYKAPTDAITKYQLRDPGISSAVVRTFGDTTIDGADAPLTIMRGPFMVFAKEAGGEKTPAYFPGVSSTHQSVGIPAVIAALIYPLAQAKITADAVEEDNFNKNPQKIFTKHLQPKSNTTLSKQDFTLYLEEMQARLNKLYANSPTLQQAYTGINLRWDLIKNQDEETAEPEIAVYLHTVGHTPPTAAKPSAWKKFKTYFWLADDMLFMQALFYWLAWGCGIILTNSSSLMLPLAPWLAAVVALTIPFAFTLYFIATKLFNWLDKKLQKSGSTVEWWNKWIAPRFDGSHPFSFSWKWLWHFLQKSVVVILMPIIALGTYVAFVKKREIYYLGNADKLPTTNILKRDFNNSYIITVPPGKPLDLYYIDNDGKHVHIPLKGEVPPQIVASMHDKFQLTLPPVEITTLVSSSTSLVFRAADASDVETPSLKLNGVEKAWFNQQIASNKAHEKEASKAALEQFATISRELAILSQYDQAIAAQAAQKEHNSTLSVIPSEPRADSPQPAPPKLTGWHLPAKKTGIIESIRFGWLTFMRRLVRTEYQLWFVVAALMYLTAFTAHTGTWFLNLNTLWLAIPLLVTSVWYAVTETRDYAAEKNAAIKARHSTDIYLVDALDLKEKKLTQYSGHYILVKDDMGGAIFKLYYIPKNGELAANWQQTPLKHISFSNNVKNALNSCAADVAQPLQERLNIQQQQSILPAIWNKIAQSGDEHRNNPVFKQQLLLQTIAQRKLDITGYKAEIAVLKATLPPGSKDAPQEPSILDATDVNNLDGLSNLNKLGKDQGSVSSINRFFNNSYWVAFSMVGLLFINSIFSSRLLFLDHTGMSTYLAFRPIKMLFTAIGIPYSAPVILACMLAYILIHAFMGIYRDRQKSQDAAEKRQYELAPLQEACLNKQATALQKYKNSLITYLDQPLTSTQKLPTDYSKLYPEPELWNTEIKHNLRHRIAYWLCGLSLAGLFSLFALSCVPAFIPLLSLGVILYTGIALAVVGAFGAFTLVTHLSTSRNILSTGEKNLARGLLFGLAVSFGLLIALYTAPIVVSSNAMYFFLAPAFLSAVFFATTLKENKQQPTPLILPAEGETLLLEGHDKESALHTLTLLMKTINPNESGRALKAAEEEEDRQFYRFKLLDYIRQRIAANEPITRALGKKVNELIPKLIKASSTESLEDSQNGIEPRERPNKQAVAQIAGFVFLIVFALLMIYLPAVFAAPLWLQWLMPSIVVGIIVLPKVIAEMIPNSAEARKEYPRIATVRDAIAKTFSIRNLTSFALSASLVALLIGGIFLPIIVMLFGSVGAYAALSPLGLILLPIISLVLLQPILASLDYLLDGKSREWLKTNLGEGLYNALAEFHAGLSKILRTLNIIVLSGLTVALPVTAFLLLTGIMVLPTTLAVVGVLCTLPLWFFILTVLLPNTLLAQLTHQETNQQKIADQKAAIAKGCKMVMWVFSGLMLIAAGGLFFAGVAPLSLLIISAVWGAGLIAEQWYPRMFPKALSPLDISAGTLTTPPNSPLDNKSLGSSDNSDKSSTDSLIPNDGSTESLSNFSGEAAEKLNGNFTIFDKLGTKGESNEGTTNKELPAKSPQALLVNQATFFNNKRQTSRTLSAPTLQSQNRNYIIHRGSE